MKSMMKKLSILLAGALLVTSLSTSPALAAKKTKTQYGYAFKGGKLVSIEIKGDKYKEKLHDSKNPLVSDKIRGDRFIYCEKYGEDKDGRYFLTDNTGKKVSGVYEDLDILEEGVFAAKKDGKWGVMDGNETILVPFEYDEVSKFSEGVYRIAIKDGKEEWKYGLVNKAGEVVLPIEYEYFSKPGRPISWSYSEKEGRWKKNIYSNTLAEIRKKSGNEYKHGLINSKGEAVLPVEYDYIRFDEYEDGTVLIEKYNKVKTEDGKEHSNHTEGLLDKEGKVLFSVDDHHISFYQDNFVDIIQEGKYVYKEDFKSFQFEGKSGLLNKKGKLILPIQYTWLSVNKISKNLASVNANHKYGFVKRGQESQVVLEYDRIGDVKDGLVLVQKDGKYGYVNKAGNLVLPMIYDYANDFSEGLAYVREGENKGFINKKGKMVFTIKGWVSNGFSDGLTLIQDDGYQFVDKKGNTVLSFSEQEFDHIDNFKKGLAKVGKKVGEEKLESGGARLIFKYGAINKQGKLVIPLEYDDVDFMDNGLIKVRVGDWETGKSGLMDKNGRLVTPIEYNWVGDFYSSKSGLIEVTKDKNNTSSGKKGLIDKNGKLIFPVEYDGFFLLKNGLIEVRKGDWKTGKIGLIDKTGKVILPLEYSSISDFGNGLISVIKGEGWDNEKSTWMNRKEGLVNVKGKWIIPCEYRYISNFVKGIVTVSNGEGDNTKEGLFTEKGRQILAPIYRYIENIAENNIYRVIKGTWEKGKQGYINKKGKFVIPLKYDFVYGFKNGSPYAEVRRKGKWGLVNKRGKVIMPLKYNNIELIQE